MRNNIYFRDYQKQDSHDLAEIIKKTWEFDKFCSEKVARDMSMLYLSSCLANQTFNKVAILDNKPVGIIMAKNNITFKSSIKNLLNQLLWIIKINSTKEGRDVIKTFGEISNLDKKLLEDCNKDFQGEIAFFVLNESCRGSGIGKALFSLATEYFNSEKVKNFFLYTDSSCNFGFYEHQGLKRCGQKNFQVPIGIKNEMEFYLYEGILEK